MGDKQVEGQQLTEKQADWQADWQPLVEAVGRDFGDGSTVWGADLVERGTIRRFTEPLELSSGLHYDLQIAWAHGFPDVIAPYTAAHLRSVVSELAIDATGKATVVWSDTLNGTARTVGAVVSIPANLAVANTYLLLGEAQYSYTPSYGYVVTGTLTLSDQIYMRPRQSSSVSRKAS